MVKVCLAKSPSPACHGLARDDEPLLNSLGLLSSSFARAGVVRAGLQTGPEPRLGRWSTNCTDTQVCLRNDQSVILNVEGLTTYRAEH